MIVDQEKGRNFVNIEFLNFEFAISTESGHERQCFEHAAVFF